MTRVLSGAVLAALAVAVVWLAPAALFLAVAGLLLGLAVVEYARLAEAVGCPVFVLPGGAAAFLTAFAVARPAAATAWFDAAVVAIGMALAGTAMRGWRGGPDALGRVAATVLPSVYLGVPVGALVAVREARGPAALFLVMLTVMVSDTAQYYTGRLFGRRPLAPAISPKKTVEGALGGFVCGALVMIGAGAPWLPDVSAPARGVLGVAVVALGIAGDLFESMLKRSAGVKDSSALIPGHGGVLDRIDALLFVAPV